MSVYVCSIYKCVVIATPLGKCSNGVNVNIQRLYVLFLCYFECVSLNVLLLNILLLFCQISYIIEVIENLKNL